MPAAICEPPRPAGRPSLKILVVLSILLGILAGQGSLPVALAQTQTANDSAVDKWLHELYSVFGIGPGGSRTLVPASTSTSTASASSITQAQNQTQKAPSQGQGGGGSRAAHGANPGGPASSTNGTSTGDSGRGHGRAVFANFVVRNAEKYTVDCWIEGIKLAVSARFDALALSVGNEPWEAGQVANAFRAASKVNNADEAGTVCAAPGSKSAFKLFLSFNMTSLPCSSAQGIDTLQHYIRTYANHTDYFRFNNRMLVSTFAGEECRFGERSLDEGWKQVLRPKLADGSAVPDVWFIPAFFAPPHTLSNLSTIDGLFNWNSAWPGGRSPVAFHADRVYLSELGNKTYVAAISLWSWARRDRNHDDASATCGTEGRSFGDRWETLINNRANVSLVEVVTWGDDFGGMGEGPSAGQLSPSHGEKSPEPRSLSRSDSIRGQKHPGKGILEQVVPLMRYYIEAFKSGSYPSVARDEVFLWVQAHPRRGNCSGSMQETGRGPRGREWIQDCVSAYALLSEPGNATLTCGPSTNTTAAVSCGLSKLGLALHDSECCKVDATLIRNSTSSKTVEQ
ncbi:hypothetical protein GSI_10418 [Ganoderma sinense ZZ0214-1]|uniref:Uncharacterized protein n=1 Tax=Ganoderma sinense ZZ0214-1 TaxID=1077348 RepID=A0A2G8S0I4_9APHY|nr:hypothetical protein GSI_10418 [Ganoderma sinense ZZ0214-1]